MSLNSDSTATLAENKVLILYILNLSNKDFKQDDLFKIISSVNDINYFYFKQVLIDLIESNLVASYTKENETIIKITSQGKDSYNLTKDVLPGLTKLKADNICAKEFSSIEEASIIKSMPACFNNSFLLGEEDARIILFMWFCFLFDRLW